MSCQMEDTGVFVNHRDTERYINLATTMQCDMFFKKNGFGFQFKCPKMRQALWIITFAATSMADAYVVFGAAAVDVPNCAFSYSQ